MQYNAFYLKIISPTLLNVSQNLQKGNTHAGKYAVSDCQ